MAQDTRKDPRAKVLSMTVRYKSATVDEFIEHHSHDVSRGGIFIKTPSPFLPGTLLKFEIRIADDKPMLQGVGRVVWKRDSTTSGPDKPAGMGVKFIKVDESSRALVDRLVEVKGGGQSAYDVELPGEGGAAAAPDRSQPAPRPGSVRPAVGSIALGPPRKGTMIGLGVDAIQAAPQQHAIAQAQATPAARAAEPMMFPKTNSEAEMPPPEERTVMKQAAELLEEALKGAGGSLEEIGSAPLDEPAPRRAAPAASTANAGHSAPAARSGTNEPARAAVAASSPPTRREASATRKSEEPASKGRATQDAPKAARAAAAPLPEPAAKKKGTGKVVLSLVLVAG